MADLYIIRHGNTFEKGDLVTRVGGRTDLRLSPSGQAQARALGEHLAGSGAVVQRLLAGPLIRTRETASLIGSRLGYPVSIEIEEGLREIDYGPDENRPEEEVVARIGEAALAAWEREAIPPQGWRVDVAGLEAFWQALIAHWIDSGETWAVVTSNGIARFALTALGERQGQLKLRTGAYGILRHEGDVLMLGSWDVRP